VSGGILLPTVLAAGVLLVAAGVGKLRRPAAAATFLDSLGFPAPFLFARVGALVEIAAAGAVLFRPRAAAGAMAVLFLFFAVLVGVQLRRRTEVPCGCLGARTTPASRWHLGLNLVGSVLCAAAVAVPPSSYSTLMRADPATAVVTGLAAASLAFLASPALELLPQTLGAWRGAEA
jgi:hypothetical protein